MGCDVRKVDAIAHFGNVGALARALGISGAAVSQWGAEVPVRRAYEIERLTEGKLQVNGCPTDKRAA